MRCTHAAALVAMMLAGSVHAQDCAAPPSTAGRLLEHHDACAAALGKAWADRHGLRALDGAPEARKATLMAAWTAAVSEIDALEPAEPALQALARRIRIRADASIAAGVADEDRRSLSSAIAFQPRSVPSGERESWLLEQLCAAATGVEGPMAEIDLGAAIHAACEAESGDEDGNCPGTVAAAWQIFAALIPAEHVASAAASDFLRGYAAHIADIDAEWTRFLTQGKPMFPLDLLATDWINRAISAEYRSPSAGFRRPPETQFYVLHPYPALEFAWDANEGEKLKAAVSLEVLGFNRWRSRRFSGAAIIVDWVDRAGVEDLGVGVQGTWNSRYSLTIAMHGGKPALLLSVDLAGLLPGTLAPAVQRVRHAPR